MFQEMTAFDAALGVADKLNSDKWELAGLLRVAVDDDGHTIREFAEARDGNHDKEDSYGGYVHADLWRIRITGLPEYEKLKEQLDISYFSLCWEMYNHREYALDMEETYEMMLGCVEKNNGEVTKKGTRWLRRQWYQATGREKGFAEYSKDIVRLWERARPMFVGAKDIRDVSDAEKAEKVIPLMDEVVEVLNEAHS